jgi:hypothetical protein
MQRSKSKEIMWTRNKGVLSALMLMMVASNFFLAEASRNTAIAEDRPTAFCKRNWIVKDYWHPLKSLPKRQNFPSSGKLRFGPMALRIFPPRRDVVLAGDIRFGVSGSVLGDQSNRHLNWRVLSQLSRINRHGTVIRGLTTRERYIAQWSDFDGQDFGARTRASPGLYKLSVQFETGSGKELGDYDEFFRVVKAQSRLELSVDRQTARSGEYRYLRVKNFGTMESVFSYKYRLWSVAQGERREVDPGPITVSADRPVAPLGQASKCFTFKVPDFLSPGKYEVGVKANNGLLRRPITLLAAFTVVG